MQLFQVNRKAVNGKNWTQHFPDGHPTEEKPLPNLELGCVSCSSLQLFISLTLAGNNRRPILSGTGKVVLYSEASAY